MVSIHRLQDEKEKQRRVMKMGKTALWWEKGKLETPTPDVITWSFAVNTL